LLPAGKQCILGHVVDSAARGTATSTSAPKTAIADDEPKPGRQLIFAIVAVTLVMSSVDQTIVATALPTIQHDLHAQLNWSSWTITIYALGQLLAMPVAGVISQQFGRKRIFLIALVVFTTSSLLCGLSSNIYELVGLRAIQAMGGGAFMPIASGIVADQYGRSRDRALGLFSSIFPLGGVIGPILGGIFVTYWSWRGIFLVNVPVGLCVFLLAAKFIPRSEPAQHRRLDITGLGLLGGTILSGMYGVTTLGSGGASVTDPQFLGFEALAVVFGVAFLRHLRVAAAPFITPQLLYGKGFAVINTINFFFGASAIGFAALVPVYAEDRFSISSLSAGTLLTARAIAMFCAAGVAVLLLRRFGYRLPMLIGYGAIAVSLFLISQEPHGVTPYVWLAIAGAITGLGIGTAQPAANNAMMQLAPTQISAVAGLRGMIRQSGSITAVSIVSAVAARSPHPGVALADAFLVFAIIVVAIMPLILFVPEHRGGW
jgi:EmrB/QacA subfamily drug resistance transporter